MSQHRDPLQDLYDDPAIMRAMEVLNKHGITGEQYEALIKSPAEPVQPYPSARVRAALAEAYDRSAPPMGWPYPPKVTQA